MISAVLISISLVLVTSGVHFSTLRWLSGGMARLVIAPQPRILLIVLAVLGTHILEIILYAVAYFAAVEGLGVGTFGGLAVKEPLDFLYFSIVTYTSLGLGDVFPSGHLRFLTGVEALNGLLLITWSGSFIYLAMGRLWPWQQCAEPAARVTDR